MTAQLTLQQFGFLIMHEVPLSRVFNADGLRASEWKQIMSAHQLWVAYGVTPCQREYHELRTRAGHCVQCNPASLAFLRRHDEGGQVYVAYSRKLRRVKVGCARDCERRAETLNWDEYGGTSDWSMRWYADCQRAGLVEFLVQRELMGFRRPVLYWRTSTECMVEAHELYQCPVKVAHEALRKVLRMLFDDDES